MFLLYIFIYLFFFRIISISVLYADKLATAGLALFRFKTSAGQTGNVCKSLALPGAVIAAERRCTKQSWRRVGQWR